MAAHANIQKAPGGIAGVDLFFVLSGFLITVLLVHERERTGRIDLGRFYVRRALRLVPALVVMLAVCCAFAALFLPAPAAAGLVHDALLAATYVMNFAMQHHWNRGAAFLHTWSLAVEEQF
jgi:peptidoglycan/LPS O-acetylase OafA/YrhL